jgi:hypothetical protein
VATTITPEAIYFGTPASLTFDGVECGATVTPPKITFEVEKYVPEFQGAKGPVKGTVVITKVIPKAELTVNEITAQKMAWAMPGCTSVVGTAPITGGGGTGTLYADAAAGATNIKVTSVTNITAGDWLKIGDVGETEVRQVDVVGTINGGTGITLKTPLVRSHDAGDAYDEVDNAGTTIITWTPGRVASSDFKTLVLTGQGLDARQIKVTILNAMSAENQEMEFGDASVTGLDLVFTGHYDGATPTVAPFSIEVG